MSADARTDLESPPSGDPKERIEALAEEYWERLRAGEPVSRRAIVSAHPDIADELEEELRLVEVLHEARPGGASVPLPETSSTGGAWPEAGPYQIVRVLGEGGMGTVYLAEQPPPLGRRVALKVVKPGMDSREILARFEAERQALARMEHPNIARVYDAGMTGSGRPYFAMEYVDGVPLTAFCDDHGLGVRDRLALFETICDAVQHAHQKGIIHRDLKPSNILVTGAVAHHAPKVIDFGVARATDRRKGEQTTFTDIGQIVGTPEYMSPEQADLGTIDIDTRTDIYSLGVILYELLVGVLPFDAERIRSAGFDALRMAIREAEPPRPSTRLVALGEGATPLALRRGTEPRVLARSLRGDLDWIVLKALEKDPGRRYATVSELAGDVRRHLDHEPVLAGPPGAAYRMRKFVRRHRAHVVGAGAFAVAVLGGLVLSLVLFTQARAARDDEARQRAAAQVEAEKARAAVTSLQEMLSAADPNRQGRDVRLVDLLERSAREASAKFAGHSEVEASVRRTIGLTFRNLDLYPAAEEQLRKAYRLRRESLGDDHRDTLQSLEDLAGILGAHGGSDEAEPLLRRAAAIRLRLDGLEAPATQEALQRLGELLLVRRRDPAEAEEIFREVWEERRRSLGAVAPPTLQSLDAVGRALAVQGRLAEATGFYEEAWRLCRDRLGPRHPRTLILMDAVVDGMVREGRIEEAVRLREEFGVACREVRVDDDPAALPAAKELALLQMGGPHLEFNESEIGEGLLRKVVAREKLLLGEDDPELLASQSRLAFFLRRGGQADEARALEEHVLERRRSVLGEGHPLTLESMVSYAEGLRERPESEEEALGILEDAVGRARLSLGDVHSGTLRAVQSYVAQLRRSQRSGEGRALVKETIEALERDRSPHDPQIFAALHWLALLASDAGDPVESEAALREMFERLRGRAAEAEEPAFLSLLYVVRKFLEQGRLDLAEGLIRDRLDRYREILPPDDLRLHRLRRDLAQVERLRGTYEEARDLMADVVRAYDRLLGPRNRISAGRRLELLRVLRDWGERDDEMLPVHERLLEIGRSLPPSDLHRNWVNGLLSATVDLANRGREEEAREALRLAMELGDRLAADDPTTRLWPRLRLGFWLEEVEPSATLRALVREEMEAAQALVEEALDSPGVSGSADPLERIRLRRALGQVHRMKGDLHEAREWAERVLSDTERHLGLTCPEAAGRRLEVLRILRDTGDREEDVLALHERIVALGAEVPAEHAHSNWVKGLIQAAEDLEARARSAEAEGALRRALEIADRLPQAGATPKAWVRLHLGRHLAASGRAVEARAVLGEVQAVLGDRSDRDARALVEQADAAIRSIESHAGEGTPADPRRP